MHKKQQYFAREIIGKGADPFWRTRHGETLLGIARRQNRKDIITRYLDSLYVLKFIQYVQEDKLDSADLLAEDIRGWNRMNASEKPPLAYLLSSEPSGVNQDGKKIGEEINSTQGTPQNKRQKLAIKLIRLGANPCRHFRAKDSNFQMAKTREGLTLESLLDSIHSSGSCGPVRK